MDSIIDELQSNLTALNKTVICLTNTIEKKEIEIKDLSNEYYLGIIDIIDSFERVEEYIVEKNLNKSDNEKKILNRYETIKKKLSNLLQNYGVTKLEFTENRLLFGFCNVVDTEPDPGKKNDTIIAIVKNGYIKGSELIREADVIIVKN